MIIPDNYDRDKKSLSSPGIQCHRYGSPTGAPRGRRNRLLLAAAKSPGPAGSADAITAAVRLDETAKRSHPR